MGSLPETSALLGAPAQPTPGVENLRPANEVNFIANEVSPPSQLYITKVDRLHVRIYAIAGAINSASLEMRYLLPNGQIVSDEEVLTPLGTNAFTNFVFALPECFLLSVSLANTGFGGNRGTIYAVIDLVRGAGAIGSYFYKLTAGYISGLNPIIWPFPAPDPPALGRGQLTNFVINPAAGAEFTITAPPNTRARILGIDAKLITDATVGTRQVTFLIGFGPTVRVAMPSTQVASLTQFYDGGPGMPFSVVNALICTFPTPVDIWTTAGGNILQSQTASKGAADQWSGTIMCELAIDA